MNRLAIGILVLALVASSAAGQCRSRSYGYGYSSYSYGYTPAYSYAPSYSYAAPSYAAPAVKVVKEEPKIIKFVAVLPLVELPSYSAVYTPPVQAQSLAPPNQGSVQGGGVTAGGGSEMQQIRIQNEQILKKLDQIDERVRKLDQRVEALERGGRFNTPAPPPKKEEQGPPPKDEGPAPKNQQAKLTAVAVNAKACAICHERGNESNGGDFVISEKGGAFVRFSDADLTRMQRVLVMAKPRMPKLNARARAAGIERMLNKEETEALYEELDRQIALGK